MMLTELDIETVLSLSGGSVVLESIKITNNGNSLEWKEQQAPNALFSTQRLKTTED